MQKSGRKIIAIRTQFWETLILINAVINHGILYTGAQGARSIYLSIN